MNKELQNNPMTSETDILQNVLKPQKTEWLSLIKAVWSVLQRKQKFKLKMFWIYLGTEKCRDSPEQEKYCKGKI